MSDKSGLIYDEIFDVLRFTELAFFGEFYGLIILELKFNTGLSINKWFAKKLTTN